MTSSSASLTGASTGRGFRSAGRVAALLLAATAVLAGCSSGTDAAVSGGSFTFVSPDG